MYHPVKPRDQISTAWANAVQDGIEQALTSIPAFFTIYREGGLYYVKSSIPNVANADFADGTDALKAAVANVPGGSYGIINLKGTETVSLSDTITINNQYVKINGNGWNFTTDVNDLDGMFLFKNLDIENQYNRPPYFAGLNDAVLDLNNKAKLGLEVRDCCFTKHKVTFRNIKANATALEVSLETDAIGCYYNKFNVMVLGQPYTAITAGSVGVLLNKIGAATNEPNFNEFTGKATFLTYGVKIVNGMTQNFTQFDLGGNTYGPYINTQLNTFNNCDCEGNANPSIVTKSGGATILGGIWDVTPTVQSDGATTGKLTFLAYNQLILASAYNAGLEHRTPELFFFQTGNVGYYMGVGDGYIYIRKLAGADEYKIDDTHFDFLNNIIKNPKNSAATALSGTKKNIEIDIAGVPYYFEVYPTKA
jgi:hypothetical protein